jgi:glycosyltransferase involved in cell wall biosynthesis
MVGGITVFVAGRIFADLTPGELANNEAATVVTFDRNFGTTLFLRKLHISGDMRRQLFNERGKVDILHSHGLWRMPNIYAARAARLFGVPHLVSSRGMLSRVALNFSRTSKALFWLAWQRAAIHQCACMHATSVSEYQEVRAFGVRRPIAIIRNGIDLPKLPSFHRMLPADGAPRARILLYFGRIHPKKGLNQLVSAWASLAPDFPDWRLRIVGPGEERDLQELAGLAAALPRLSIEAAVYGEAKWRIFAQSDLFILPSHNENFGITVAESLACGRPVITTKETPWKDVETQKCGWWIEAGSASIKAALRVALGTPVEVLDEMGARGAAWVKNAFSWDQIGEEMARVYRWLCLGAARPDCVVLD